MDSQKRIVAYCLTLPDAYEDYPFDNHSVALRHKGNKKIFALLLEHNGIPMINLKCEPMEAGFWRGVYEGVIPGYHMNKEHWNSVILNDGVPQDILKSMIDVSYELTKPKRKREMASP